MFQRKKVLERTCASEKLLEKANEEGGRMMTCTDEKNHVKP